MITEVYIDTYGENTNNEVLFQKKTAECQSICRWEGGSERYAHLVIGFEIFFYFFRRGKGGGLKIRGIPPSQIILTGILLPLGGVCILSELWPNPLIHVHVSCHSILWPYNTSFTWPVNVCSKIKCLSLDPLHLLCQLFDRDAFFILDQNSCNQWPRGDNHVF